MRKYFNKNSIGTIKYQMGVKRSKFENQCFVIGVNRIGTDGNNIHYPGASHIFDPLRNDICSGGETDEYLVGEFDPAEVFEIRSRFPFLQDMRADSYV